MLGAPCGPGGVWSPKTAVAMLQASKNHTIEMTASIGSWDNHNILWSQALNKGRKGEIDCFAMCHSDIELDPGWLDTLYDVMVARGAALCSAIVPQKGPQGITSSGIGTFDDPWTPHRRFTMSEVWAPNAPDTFDANDCGYPDKYILHNNGCWIADMKELAFYRTEVRNGREFYKCCFDFPHSIQHLGGEACAKGESEDWYFSRVIHELGIKSCITRKVALDHCGPTPYGNQKPWGEWQHDEATRPNWEGDHQRNTTVNA